MLELTRNTFYYDAYLFPNDGSCSKDADPEIYRSDIVDINRLSGLNFLYNVNQHLVTVSEGVRLDALLAGLLAGSTSNPTPASTSENELLQLREQMKQRTQKSVDLQRQLRQSEKCAEMLILQIQTKDAEIQNSKRRLILSETENAQVEAKLRKSMQY